MTNNAFIEEFPYFSVNVPTAFPSAGASDPLAAQHQGSPNSYLRLGDTPTAADLNGLNEPGFEQRSELTGTPAWPLDLYRSFAPDSSDTAPNGDVLRVDAGSSEPFDVNGNYYQNVGWLDHCNGHRFSTTHGDKVEVITGNYKLVVFGREGDAQKSTGFDMSGGHTGTWAQTPGAIRTITSEAGRFKVTDVTDSGHNYSVFDGFDTYHLVGGSSAISVMGGDNDRTEKGSGPAELVVDAAWSKKIFDSDYATTVVNIDAGDLSLLAGTQQASEGAAGAPLSPWPQLSETDDLNTQSAAFTVAPTSFEDVELLPKAKTIIEARSAESFVEWVSADSFVEQSKATTMNETMDVTHINSQMDAEGDVVEVWRCGRYLEEFYGNRTNLTIGATDTEIHASVNLLDTSISGFSLEFTGLGLSIGLDAHLLELQMSTSALGLDLAAGLHVERSPTPVVWNDSKTCTRLVALRQGVGASIESRYLKVKAKAIEIFS